MRYEPLNEFFVNLPFAYYFSYFALRLRDFTLALNRVFLDKVEKNPARLLHVYEDFQDELMFVADLLNIGNKEVTMIMVNSLFYYYIIPIICKTLVAATKVVY